MSRLFRRILAIVLHLLLNVFVVTWVMQYDVTASWITFSGFVSLVLILLIFFTLHLISFFYFIKSTNK